MKRPRKRKGTMIERDMLRSIPDLPGVYIMKDGGNRIVYIGKAGSLRKRVTSYFRKGGGHSERTGAMVGRISDISFLVTSSEAEALIAEAALIKKYKPRYNVALKDDKSYPYLKVTMKEEFPRVYITRDKTRDGSYYFGPYTDVRLLRKAVTFMKRIFPLRTCNRMPHNVCLNYHIGQCSGPCAQKITAAEYGQTVKELILFLKGKRRELITELSRKMKEAAHDKHYEKAREFRDRMRALSIFPGDKGRQVTLKGAKSLRENFRRMYDEIACLRGELGLKRVPRRIEAFDISNIQGRHAVGSMVLFVDGRPHKNGYRRFKIRTVEGIDDCAMMAEIIRRRYARLRAERNALPDLVVVDGGRGQLNSARHELRAQGLAMPVIGIAKKHEHLIVHDRAVPVVLSRHSPALHLIQRLRDEAHRFAISYHKRMRSRAMQRSVLDRIPGVGPVRKKALLCAFGSAEKVCAAHVSELCRVPGINTKTARRIRTSLKSLSSGE